MVRLSMAMGDGALLPPGCRSIADCPAELVMVIAHASFILRASEQLMEDEEPPSWKWRFDEEIQAHMERVKRKRDERFGNKSTSQDDEPAGGWQENEFARNLR